MQDRNHGLAFLTKTGIPVLLFANCGLAFVSFLVLLVKMKRKYPKGKFTKHAFDRHRKMLAEIPENISQQQNIHNRNQMLSATQAYNLKLEQQRIQSHISDFAAPLQKAMAQHHMGDLDRRIHRLASSGLP